LTLITLSLLLAAVLTGSAEAAVPRLIMVYGAPLTRPVVLDGWYDEAGQFVSAFYARNGEVADLGVQPTWDEESLNLSPRLYLKLAIFWGPLWDNYVREGQPLDALRPEDAEHEGRFYPAVGEAPPAIIIKPVGSTVWSEAPRTLGPEDVEVLALRGVPTRLSSDAEPISLPGSGAQISADSKGKESHALWLGVLTAAAIAGAGGLVILGRRLLISGT